MFLVVALCFSSLACAHDPSAYGGLFRSRDTGATWLNADVGLFLGAAVALAIDPKDANHLLLGTDSGVLVSRSGGRQWERAQPDRLFGPVFAVGFSPDGAYAMCVSPAGVFRLADGQWQQVRAPVEAAPGRVLRWASPAEIYLAGRSDLYRSLDAGASWSRVEHDLGPQATFTELQVSATSAPALLAIVDGRIRYSSDGATRWRERHAGLGSTAEGLSVDAQVAGRVWVASDGSLFVSDDEGMHWRRVGPLMEAGISVRGIFADASGQQIVAATHRGAFRSADAGRTWVLLEANLPVHLEARPLVADRSAPGTVYIGFALMPYEQIWRNALEGGNLLSRVDPISLAGALAFFVLLILLGVLAARWLRREDRAAATVRRT